MYNHITTRLPCSSARTYCDGDDQDPVLLVRVDYFRLHLRLRELVRRWSFCLRLFLRLLLVHLSEYQHQKEEENAKSCVIIGKLKPCRSHM